MFSKWTGGTLLLASVNAWISEYSSEPLKDMPIKAPYVDIPDGEWTLNSARFALVELEPDDPIWEWGTNLPYED